MEKIKSLLKMNNLPDEKERKEALDITKSFVVVAPAGSGKTQLLIKRYLTLLQTARAIDCVICLTYTKKATEEMRERVFKAIKNCKRANPKDENEKELFEIAKKVYENKNIKEEELLNPHSFQISTFHSFCANILKKYPNENSLSNFETLEENQAPLLYQKTAELLLSKAAVGEDENLKNAVARRLAILNEKSDHLKNQIISLLHNRDRLMNVNVADTSKYDDIIKDLLNNFTSNIAKFFSETSQNFNDLLQYFEDDVKNSLNYPFEVTKDNLSHWVKVANVVLSSSSGTPRKQKFPGPFKLLPKNLKEYILTIPDDTAKELNEIRNISKKGINSFDEESFEDTAVIFNEAVKIFDSLLEGNKKDFIELELSAVKNLEWINGLPPEALEKMQFKIDHLLIDEAQDLSDIEYKIISRLIEGWQEGDRRTIFFVGDPKQSIYRFRKSNVALFSLLTEKGVVRKDEEDYKLVPLELKVNFRSEPQIIDFVNRVFKKYFQKDSFSDDVSYSPFFHPQENPSENVDISVNKLENNSKITLFACNDKDENKNILPKKFAETISSLSEKLDDNETIGILYKQRTFFDKYRKALLEYGINVETIEEDKLEASPAVNHLLNFLKAVLLPDEDLYWLLLLGSPWLDLSPKEIYKIKEQKHEKWRDKALSAEAIEEAKRNILKKATEDFYYEKNAITFLKHFEELSGFESVKKIYGLKAVEDCRKFFEIVSSISNLAPKELIAAAEDLTKNIFAPSEPLIPKNRIQAMTIHKAKGLEFDYVFVIGLEKSHSDRGGKQEKSPILIERLGFDDDEKEFVFLSAPYEKNELTYELLKELDKKRQESEYKRLYYVALTRAKKGLFLFGQLNKNNTITSKSILKVVADAHSLTQESFILIELSEYESSEDRKEKLEPPNPPSFEPQRIPFKISRASEEVNLSNETHLLTKNSEEKIKMARAKGIAIHKILENLAKGKNSVSVDFVKKLLKESNVKFNEDFAKEILDEAQSAWNIDDFKKLREKGKLIPEFPLEMEREGDIEVGRIDLLILGKDEAFTVDHKTGTPQGDKEDWMNLKIEEYKPQVKIYKTMVSLKEKIQEEKIKTFILFTKIGCLREV